MTDDDRRDLRFQNLWNFITPDTTDSDVWSEIWDEDENPLADLTEYRFAVVETYDNDDHRRFLGLHRDFNSAARAFTNQAIRHAVDDSWQPLGGVIDLDTGIVHQVSLHGETHAPGNDRENHIADFITHGKTEEHAVEHVDKHFTCTSRQKAITKARLDHATPGSSGFAAFYRDLDNNVTRSWTHLTSTGEIPDSADAEGNPVVSEATKELAAKRDAFNFELV